MAQTEKFENPKQFSFEKKLRFESATLHTSTDPQRQPGLLDQLDNGSTSHDMRTYNIIIPNKYIHLFLTLSILK